MVTERGLQPTSTAFVVRRRKCPAWLSFSPGSGVNAALRPYACRVTPFFKSLNRYSGFAGSGRLVNKPMQRPLFPSVSAFPTAQ